MEVLRRVVTADDTAAVYGAGFPPVASTPFVLGLAEVACHQAVAADLDAGMVTVGVRAVVEHDQPTPIGGVLEATVVIVGREGRRIQFQVTVRDEGGEVARVEHERAIVAADRITAAASAR